MKFTLAELIEVTKIVEHMAKVDLVWRLQGQDVTVGMLEDLERLEREYPLR